MAKKLSKGVLNGTQHTETLPLTWKGEEYEVDIRPLNDKEATEIELLEQEGIDVKVRAMPGGKRNQSIDLNLQENHRGRKKADIKTVALGTVDKEITEDVVAEEFPPKLIKEIATRIREITGMGNNIGEFEKIAEEELPSKE